ncbi:putative serine/threonine-protein kinase PBL28 [Pseudolycoriella hygida]|uniref:Serine/threonine-protein kinase PBL28 n=1 Tax=Pseudolycoriella hygida TaxID=35572 RepID=A0A9Q0S5T2_9DIPT|nr:putative serine/threonine-protein kinase PBL28 [Pseudolycoriella hygida]
MNCSMEHRDKKAVNFCKETELVRERFNQVIDGYKTEWRKQTGMSCLEKKSSEALTKTEDYILNCLENNWRKVDNILKTVDGRYQPNVKSILRGLMQRMRKDRLALLSNDSNTLCPIEPIDCCENLKLREKEIAPVSNSLYNDPHTSSFSKNFHISADCDMARERPCDELNDSCSEDFLFPTNIVPQITKSKALSLELPPFSENSINKVMDKSFKDLDNVDTLNITSPTAIPLQNNQVCYINFSKMWKDDRWSAVRKRLIQRGLMDWNGMYVVFPIYRNEFVIGRGNFGNVEFGLSRTYYGIALKRLTENGFCRSSYDDIQSVLSRFSDLNCENLHKTIAFQDIAGHLFLSSRICEYNLCEYVELVKSNSNEWNIQRKLSLFEQIVKGLTALHLNSPIIVHGNLKPTNVLIDEKGVAKLTEFGLFSSLGLLTFFIYSNGEMVSNDTIRDVNIQQHNAEGITLELVQLLRQMLHHDPIQRPTIGEIHKHIFFWPKQRKREFLLTCIATISNEASLHCPNRPKHSLYNYLETIWRVHNVKACWISQTFINLPCDAIPKEAQPDSPIDLVKFLVKSHNENEDLFCEQGAVFETYSELPFLIYTALKLKEQMIWEIFPDLRAFLV